MPARWSFDAALLLLAVASCSTASPPAATQGGAHAGAAGLSGTGAVAGTAAGGAATAGASASSSGGGGGVTVDAGLPDRDAGLAGGSGGGAATPHIHVLAIGQGEPEIHAPFVKAALAWLDQVAAEGNLSYTHVENPSTLTDALLADYGLIFQMNYVPFGWSPTARAALEKYVSEGRGGWVGLHHASLYGPVVWPAGEPTWDWYYDFIGQVNFKNYIASFAEASVHVEEATHPIFKGVPATFQVTTDEWYTWDKNPRPHVHVLANVDESSYVPPSDIKMGDHPVIWSNEAYKAKNVYIFVGHHPNLFDNAAYKTLLRNALFWAATPKSGT